VDDECGEAVLPNVIASAVDLTLAVSSSGAALPLRLYGQRQIGDNSRADWEK
jgi:hypothetical protein